MSSIPTNGSRATTAPHSLVCARTSVTATVMEPIDRAKTFQHHGAFKTIPFSRKLIKMCYVLLCTEKVDCFHE